MNLDDTTRAVAKAGYENDLVRSKLSQLELSAIHQAAHGTIDSDYRWIVALDGALLIACEILGLDEPGL